ncbi:MAG: ferritin [candidate division Zixibacteria bacterium]
MAIGKKIIENFNAQMQREFYSSYLYLAMAGYFEDMDMKGCAHWMRMQAEEERMHAMKFYDFIASRGGRLELLEIEKPPKEWKSPLDAFEETLKHEESVTTHINNLVDIALEEKDHAAHSFLQFFVDEQVEEEDQVNEILAKIRMVKDSAGGMFMFDSELAKRPMPMPITTTE